MLEHVAGKASLMELFAGRREVSEAGDTNNGRQCVQHAGLTHAFQLVLFYCHCGEPKKL